MLAIKGRVGLQDLLSEEMWKAKEIGRKQQREGNTQEMNAE